MEVLGEVLNEEGNRLVDLPRAYGLVVIEHQYNRMGQLGDLVYERGKRCLDETLSHGAHPRENIGSEIFFWHDQAQRLDYVPPQPDRIVVLLVEMDPGEGQIGFLYLTPVGQERRLPVASRGAYDANLALQGVVKELEQPATDDLLGTRQRRPQLGLEDDPGKIDAWVTRGVYNGLLRPAPLSMAAHTHLRADGAPLAAQRVCRRPSEQGPSYVLRCGI